MKTFELKVGDILELREDLKNGNYYENIIYYSTMPQRVYVLALDHDKKAIVTETHWWFSLKMISKVNDRKVKFIKGFEYIIKEDEMINPVSLIESGDFVVYEWEGEEYSSVAIQRGSKIALAQYPVGWGYLDDDDFKVVIKKIFRYDEGNFRLGDAFDKDFEKNCGKFIYDSERDSVKEVTMEELEQVYGRKVKIVKG